MIETSVRTNALTFSREQSPSSSRTPVAEPPSKGSDISAALNGTPEALSNEHSGYRVLIPINSQESALYALESAMARKWPEDTHFMLDPVIEGLAGSRLESKVVHKDVLLAEQDEHRVTVQKWLKNLTNTFKQVFPNTDSEIECGGNETDGTRQLVEQAPKRIIIATDFSQQAATAIQWVADSHWLDNTEIRLVKVTAASKRQPGVSFLTGSKGYFSEQQHQRTIESRLRIIGVALAFKNPRCKREVLVLQSDSVAGAILELACMWDADLVVLGAESSGGCDDAKIGSTALQIMDTLECSSMSMRNGNSKQVHFSWYPELQKANYIGRQAAKTKAKKS